VRRSGCTCWKRFSLTCSAQLQSVTLRLIITKQSAFCELLLVAKQCRSNLVILMVAKRGRLHCDSKTPTLHDNWYDAHWSHVLAERQGMTTAGPNCWPLLAKASHYSPLLAAVGHCWHHCWHCWPLLPTARIACHCKPKRTAACCTQQATVLPPVLLASARVERTRAESQPPPSQPTPHTRAIGARARHQTVAS
jgi:hypothetical protein